MKKTRLNSKTLLGLVLTYLFIIYSCDSNKSGTYIRIKKAVDDIWIIDTHEHFGTEARRVESNVDFFTLIGGYLYSDMLSSGMTNDERTFITNKTNLIEDRWSAFYHHWEDVKNTGYGRCLSITVKGLFGIDKIDENTIPIINRKMAESNKKAGWYKYVLRDKSRIDLSIVFPMGINAPIFPADQFLKVKDTRHFIMVSRENIAAIEKQYGESIFSLSDYLNVLDIAFKKAVDEEGVIGIKSEIAYYRTLYFEDVPRDEAELLFRKFRMSQILDKSDQKKLEDFMMHQVIERAVKYGLPFQIHTGILAGNFNNNPIQNTNAINLINLFLKFREAKFVLFHGNFPYMGELSYLAKQYPNVYIDMCWMYIVAPSASKYLEDWLTMVPSNKIMAFGGDHSVEWAYGHSIMARKTITEVLVKMVLDGYFTEDEAIIIAEKILRKNALELFKIEKVNNQWRRVL